MDIAVNFWFDLLGKWLYGITDLVSSRRMRFEAGEPEYMREWFRPVFFTVMV